MENLNGSPELSLSSIMQGLFNKKFLSDITFVTSSGKEVIYAHSLILMSRSVVYQKQLESNQNTQKLMQIPISDYKIFLEFISFMYKDKCTVTSVNQMQLLELAIDYKIPKLENLVLEHIMGNTNQWNVKSLSLDIYKFCLQKKYTLLKNWAAANMGPQMLNFLKSDYFINLDQETIEEFYKHNVVGTHANPITEFDLFNALVAWMNNYCRKNNIELCERRSKFDRLIRLIRFPVMKLNELNECIEKSDNLLTDSDRSSFIGTGLALWNCNSRQPTASNVNCIPPKYCGGTYDSIILPAFTFGVSRPLIIIGIHTGINQPVPKPNSYSSVIQPMINKLIFRCTTDQSQTITIPITIASKESIISFGDKIRLKPNLQYRIELSYDKCVVLPYRKSTNLKEIIKTLAQFVTINCNGYEYDNEFFKEVFFEIDDNSN